jgi:hypothetical protein
MFGHMGGEIAYIIYRYDNDKCENIPCIYILK